MQPRRMYNGSIFLRFRLAHVGTVQSVVYHKYRMFEMRVRIPRPNNILWYFARPGKLGEICSKAENSSQQLKKYEILFGVNLYNYTSFFARRFLMAKVGFTFKIAHIVLQPFCPQN